MLTREQIERWREDFREGHIFTDEDADALCSLAIAGLGAQGAGLPNRRPVQFCMDHPTASLTSCPRCVEMGLDKAGAEVSRLTAELEEARKERDRLTELVTFMALDAAPRMTISDFRMLDEGAKFCAYRDACVERDALQAANRAMGEVLGQCQRHMHHCDESDSKILELRIKQALQSSIPTQEAPLAAQHKEGVGG